MSNEYIREKIILTDFGKRILENFENTIGEIEFYKNPSGYFCQPKGVAGFSEEALNQEPANTIAELVMFLYGVYASNNIRVKEDVIPKKESERK